MKNIIIIGEPNSGKSLMARGVLSEYEPLQRQSLSLLYIGKHKNDHSPAQRLFYELQSTTKVVLVEDIPLEYFKELAFLCKDGKITINPRLEPIQEIQVQFILQFVGKPELVLDFLGKKSIQRHYKVFQTQQIQ